MKYRLGFVSDKESESWVGGSSFLPNHNFYEVHESGAINAGPNEIIEAVSTLDMRADKVADALLTIRELPKKAINIFRKEFNYVDSAPFGFDTFTLLQKNSHELSLGLVGRFWRPDLGIVDISDAQEFVSFYRQRVSKLVVRFQVIEYPDGSNTLRTETFVDCPDFQTKVLFTPYWLGIRLASGLIRRRTLSSIRSALNT